MLQLPASKMLKINKLRIALMNHAQTVIGILGSVMPSVRRSMVVTVKFSALNSAASEKTEALMSQRFMPEFIVTKKEAIIPIRDPAVIQKQSRLSDGTPFRVHQFAAAAGNCRSRVAARR